MRKTKDWEQVWFDGQTYSWTNLMDWAEHAGGASFGAKKPVLATDKSCKDWWEQISGVSPQSEGIDTER